MQFEHDFLIIGSGAAGLTLALQLAEHGNTAVIAKSSLYDSNTTQAQGGISAVLSQHDSVQSHVEDTVGAGAGLCQKPVVEKIVGQGKLAISQLIDLGVPFTKETLTDGHQRYHLTREGGHTNRRVIHAADATGQAVSCSLIDHAKQHKNIHLYENYIAIDLIHNKKTDHDNQRCFGSYALAKKTGDVVSFKAKFTILCTGGASKVYLYTSNPDIATGDGVAMAWRAGCRVGNMEFIQFHPTCLFHPEAKSYLITEALRGEGAHLQLPDGSRFMHSFDEREELAPRDIVARAIDHEMKRLGVECVYLDISHKPADFIIHHFPNIFARCQQFGIDITRDRIPVVPAAHYTCGGVVVDEFGQTDINGLYAIGEASFSGLHGANRMASNSLLECLTYANFCSQHIIQSLAKDIVIPDTPDWDESQVTDSDEEVVVAHNWDELRRFMWDYVGIVRTDKRLQRAKRRVDLLKLEISEYYGHFRVTNDLIELRNLVTVADLIIQSALLRKESRGLHYTLDYPAFTDTPANTILVPR
jgi:L-aspartate oxidase